MTIEQKTAETGVGKQGLCSGCNYNPEYLNSRRCTPGDACIRAHSGRQIDRFLRQNRDEAVHFLDDIFWERRAIAVRYSPVDTIFRLKSDPDEVVRRVVVTRLPVEQLEGMIGDPDREVRLSVASRLPEPEVRAIVAERALPGLAASLLQDQEWWVRLAAVANAPVDYLPMLADDPEPEVRDAVKQRLADSQAA